MYQIVSHVMNKLLIIINLLCLACTDQVITPSEQHDEPSSQPSPDRQETVIVTASPTPRPIRKYITVLTIGQSNMSGRGEQASPIADDKALVWKHNKWEHLVDPYGSEMDSQAAGSLMPGFVNRLVDKLHMEVRIIPAALGNTPMVRIPDNNLFWSDLGSENTLFSRALEQVQAAGVPVDVILMNQGESDAIANVSTETYYIGLVTMINGFRSALDNPKLPLVMVHIGDLGNRAPWSNVQRIRDAQTWTVSLPQVYIGADDLDLNGTKIDCCHYDTPALTQLGETLGDTVSQIFIDSGS